MRSLKAYKKGVDMKKLIACLFCISLINANELLEKFDEYPATIYQGEHKIPKDYQCSNGECRDINNKLVDLSINFAGKYSIIAHSCGTGCRFYSMLNVENGEDNLKILSSFNTIPDVNGKETINDLFSKNDSRLLVVKTIGDTGCKQETFLFDGNSLELLSQLESCIEQ